MTCDQETEGVLFRGRGVALSMWMESLKADFARSGKNSMKFDELSPETQKLDEVVAAFELIQVFYGIRKELKEVGKPDREGRPGEATRCRVFNLSM